MEKVSGMAVSKEETLDPNEAPSVALMYAGGLSVKRAIPAIPTAVTTSTKRNFSR